MSEHKKGHRPDQGRDGDHNQQQVYRPPVDLSTLQDLVIGFLAKTQSPYLDAQDQAIAWAGFDLTLRQLVGVRHGI